MKFKLIDAMRSYMPLRTDHKMKFYIPVKFHKVVYENLDFYLVANIKF
jgi:hypothetical protein